MELLNTYQYIVNLSQWCTLLLYSSLCWQTFLFIVYCPPPPTPTFFFSFFFLKHCHVFMMSSGCVWYSANPFDFNSLYLLSKWNWKVLILQRALELAQTKCQKRFFKWCVFISMCYSKCSAGEYIFGDWRQELIYFAVAFDYNFTITSVWISASIFVLPVMLEYGPS